ETTRCTPDSPRAFSEARNSRQNSKDSLSPTAVPSTSRVPSMDTPVATTSAWETTWAPMRTLQKVASEEHVRKRRVGQAAAAKRLDLAVQAGADPRDLRLRHPGSDTECGDEVIDTARGDTVDVGLDDHRVQGAVDAPTPFQQRREERTGPQLGDLDLDIASGGRDHLAPVPVAMRAAF